jgi:hypothetical protein
VAPAAAGRSVSLAAQPAAASATSPAQASARTGYFCSCELVAPPYCWAFWFCLPDCCVFCAWFASPCCWFDWLALSDWRFVWVLPPLE